MSFGMVNHHDMLQNGPLWMERHQRASSRNLPGDHGSLVNDMQSLNLYNPVQSRSHGHLPLELPACTSGRQNHLLQDEFPHLDIINDLLDDEHGLGMVARVNSGYQSFSNGHHNLNRHYSFPGDPTVSSGLGPSVSSCRFDRSRSYHDDGFQHGQVGSGRTYDTVGDMIPQASRPYVNGQIDGILPNQWQMAGSDMPYLNIRNMDSDGYPYHLQDYQNLTIGINGYSVFRPSSGL
ncbi:UNVERIFIED_CONTAM: TNF receptor-associated factor1a [Sesamum radiatum]|uniref:TNF receptor-associated factor1a n=1 Tax=Sesamum radiatum TaxID=300843 RepID=A0AAW2QIJ7_SESRA